MATAAATTSNKTYNTTIVVSMGKTTIVANTQANSVVFSIQFCNYNTF